MRENYKPELKSLEQVKDRLTFLYVERSTINREDNSITVASARGIVHIPSADLTVLMLGPGTSVTHQAVELASETGLTLIWVGERGVRYYAHGRSLTHSAALLLKQAELVSNTRKRLAVARKMYQMRFEGEDVSTLTMQQLRGREGARIRQLYRKMSKETGVPWKQRDYDPKNFQKGDPVNQALTLANACMYGLAHAAIVSLGISPGLGFVHTGHERAFVFDLADLYKAQYSIPVAFRITAQEPENLEGEIRREMRNQFVKGRLLAQMIKDIHYLLSEENEQDAEVDVLALWDEKSGEVPAGTSY